MIVFYVTVFSTPVFLWVLCYLRLGLASLTGRGPVTGTRDWNFLQGTCSSYPHDARGPCSGGPAGAPGLPSPGFLHGASPGFRRGSPSTGDLNFLQASLSSVFHQPDGPQAAARTPGAARRCRCPSAGPLPRGVQSGPRGLGTCTWPDGASALVLPAVPERIMIRN